MTAPDLQFHVDTRPLNRVMRDLVIASGKDADTVVFQQSRLFAEQALKRTPPKTQAQGNRAVEGDLNKIIGTASEEFIRGVIKRNGGEEDIRVPYNRKDGTPFLIEWNRASLTGEGLEEHHNRNRTKNGRVSTAGDKSRDIGRWRARDNWIVPPRVKKRYVAKMKKRVGRLKAGWLPTLERLKSKKIPKFVDRHFGGARGSITIRGLGTGDVATVMVNRARGAGEIRHIVNEALRIRTSAMKRELRIIASGYAEDVWRGIRARSRARRTR